MGKKILFVGNRSLLTAILECLKGTSFISENNIDIIIRSSSPINKLSIGKLVKRLKKGEMRFVINRFFDKLFFSLNLHFYRKQTPFIKKTIFPERDFGYLNKLQNVNFLEYTGLDFENLETYDFMIVASFSYKIPKEILDKPRRGTLNIHPSYLPELRGGNPLYIQAYLKMNCCSTTIHYMDEKWDHGDIVVQKSIDIHPGATFQERMDKSALVAADLLNDIHKNNFEFSAKPQDHTKATYCHKTLKTKKNITSFSKEEDFEGFVAANYHESMYPFSYTYRYGFLFSILKVKKMEHMKGYKNKGLFYLDGRYYYAFYGDIYWITLYIYKGKLIDSSKIHHKERKTVIINESAA